MAGEATITATSRATEALDILQIATASIAVYDEAPQMVVTCELEEQGDG